MRRAQLALLGPRVRKWHGPAAGHDAAVDVNHVDAVAAHDGLGARVQCDDCGIVLGVGGVMRGRSVQEDKPGVAEPLLEGDDDALQLVAVLRYAVGPLIVVVEACRPQQVSLGGSNARENKKV